jgi:hypothetical protein
MKTLALMITALLLSACATPQPIVQTAALVSKMSTEMDRSVTSYAQSLSLLRESDARRVARTRADAQQDLRSLADDMKVLKLTEDASTAKTLMALTEESAPDPLRAAKSATGKTAPKLSFDSAPLANVAKVTAGIAEPRSEAEQLRALVTFARQVNDDLNKAAAENKEKAKE